jgi:hypothetical protein
MNSPISHLWRVQSARSVRSETTHDSWIRFFTRLVWKATTSVDTPQNRITHPSYTILPCPAHLRKFYIALHIGASADVTVRQRSSCRAAHAGVPTSYRDGIPSQFRTSSERPERIRGKADLATGKMEAWGGLGADSGGFEWWRGGEGCKKLPWRTHRGVRLVCGVYGAGTDQVGDGGVGSGRHFERHFHSGLPSIVVIQTCCFKTV